MTINTSTDKLRANARYTMRMIAEHLGVSRSTLSTYLARRLPARNPFPQPDHPYTATGAQWYGRTINAWVARRPGHGGRTS